MTRSASSDVGRTPSLLSGTEPALVAQVPKAGERWKQVHFNADVMRRFFHLEHGNPRSVTLEHISADGTLVGRTSRQLVFSDVNSNSKLEFDFGSLKYPRGGSKPILVAVEAAYLTFRYRLVMPGDIGFEQLTSLLESGQSIGRGVPRRIVTLDDVESYWPSANLRGC